MLQIIKKSVNIIISLLIINICLITNDNAAGIYERRVKEDYIVLLI